MGLLAKDNEGEGMTDRKLLSNAIENPCAMLTFQGTPNWTQGISLSGLLTGNIYIMDGTECLKTNIAEIMRMIRAREGVTHEKQHTTTN